MLGLQLVKEPRLPGKRKRKTEADRVAARMLRPFVSFSIGGTALPVAPSRMKTYALGSELSLGSYCATPGAVVKALQQLAAEQAPAAGVTVDQLMLRLTAQPATLSAGATAQLDLAIDEVTITAESVSKLTVSQLSSCKLCIDQRRHRAAKRGASWGWYIFHIPPVGPAL